MILELASFYKVILLCEVKEPEQKKAKILIG
jgi:hypothetical protein